MLGYVLADGRFFESRYRFEVFDLPLQRQVAVAAMFERVFRIVDVEPAGYSGVHAQELHEYLSAAYRVENSEVALCFRLGAINKNSDDL